MGQGADRARLQERRSRPLNGHGTEQPWTREVHMFDKSWRLAASCVAVCGTLAGSQASAQTADRLTLEVLSSQPQLVSGGDALVKVSGAHGAPAVTVDGRDVSGAFKSDSKGGWIGLVD